MMLIGARGYKVAMLMRLEVSTCPIPLPEAAKNISHTELSTDLYCSSPSALIACKLGGSSY
jgi:hypothetical protein